MAKLSKKQLAGFQEFMDGIDTSYWIQNLVKEMIATGRLSNDEINFDLETLQKVEDFLFDVYDGKIQVNDDIKEIRFWVAAYFGEVFIEIVGGEWTPSTYADEYHGYPAIDKWSGEADSDGPGEGVFLPVFEIVDNAMERHDRGRLVRAVQDGLKTRQEVKEWREQKR